MYNIDDYINRVHDIEYAIEAINFPDKSSNTHWRILNDNNLGIGLNKTNIIFIIYSVHSPDLEPRKFNIYKSTLDGIISPVRYKKFLKIAQRYGFNNIDGINVDWMIGDLKNNAASERFVYNKTRYIYNWMRRQKKFTRDTIISLGNHNHQGIMAMDLLIEGLYAYASEKPDVLVYVYSAHYRDLAMVINEPVIIEGYLEWMYVRDVISSVFKSKYSKSMLQSIRNENIYIGTGLVDYNDPTTSGYLSSEQLDHMDLYHVSTDPTLAEKGIGVWSPASPMIYENIKTKRACVAPSIEKCLMGVSRDKLDNWRNLSVYKVITSNDITGFKPTRYQVPDVDITDEIWLFHKNPNNGIPVVKLDPKDIRLDALVMRVKRLRGYK